MKKGTKVAVIGYHDGNAGQIAEWFEDVTGYEIDCYVAHRDDPIRIDVQEENRKRVSQKLEYPGIDSFKGRPLIYSTKWPAILQERGISHILPMDSSNRDRWRTLEMAREVDLALVSAIHPSAILLDKCEIEPGVWVNARAVIGYKAEIKAGVMINTGVIVEHHNVLESCCQVDPGVTFGGNVTLRARSHVHMGAILFNRVEVGEDAEVGAGSLVRHSIPTKTCYVGVPAKFHRNVE